MHPSKSIFRSMQRPIIIPTASNSKGWPLCALNAWPARKYTFDITHYPAITSYAMSKYYMVRYEYLGRSNTQFWISFNIISKRLYSPSKFKISVILFGIRNVLEAMKLSYTKRWPTSKTLDSKLWPIDRECFDRLTLTPNFMTIKDGLGG